MKILPKACCFSTRFSLVVHGGSGDLSDLASTVGGLAPLIMETDLQAKFLIPMALSIAAGIAFATVLTLVLVPSLLALLSDCRLLAHRLNYGFWPKRVDVEPARNRYVDLLEDESGLETMAEKTIGSGNS